MFNWQQITYDIRTVLPWRCLTYIKHIEKDTYIFPKPKEPITEQVIMQHLLERKSEKQCKSDKFLSSLINFINSKGEREISHSSSPCIGKSSPP